LAKGESQKPLKKLIGGLQMTKTNRAENNMKFIRLRQHMTLDDLFLKTGIWQSKLSTIERGVFKPKQEEKEKISEALNSSIATIFPETGSLGVIPGNAKT